jgi:hypothetical protein
VNAPPSTVRVEFNARPGSKELLRPSAGLKQTRHTFALVLQSRGLEPSSAGPGKASGLTLIRQLTVLYALGFAPLQAHDIYSSWTEAVVRTDRLELTVTLARASAPRLVASGNSLPPITPENFAEFAPRLKSASPGLFEISAAGRILKLTSSEVKISGDADVTFHLVYPRPVPGLLRFAVNYLFQLVDGHVGTLVVTDAAGKDLGWSPVTVDQPVFEIRLPPTTTANRPR